VPIDAREFHVYAAERTPEHVAFSIDGEHVIMVGQSPSYPMQLMLSLYEFPNDDGTITGAYPKEFVVDYVRGYPGGARLGWSPPAALYTLLPRRRVLETSEGSKGIKGGQRLPRSLSLFEG
jgi:hypothetical protein